MAVNFRLVDAGGVDADQHARIGQARHPSGAAARARVPGRGRLGVGAQHAAANPGDGVRQVVPAQPAARRRWRGSRQPCNARSTAPMAAPWPWQRGASWAPTWGDKVMALTFTRAARANLSRPGLRIGAYPETRRASVNGQKYPPQTRETRGRDGGVGRRVGMGMPERWRRAGARGQLFPTDGGAPPGRGSACGGGPAPWQVHVRQARGRRMGGTPRIAQEGLARACRLLWFS